ncbi:MAG: RNA polymerase sigma factor [Muribaculaceae bacterium]|nr:RNA polymerase sigma factor [Muribaculaceae bacterium]
MQQHPFEHQAPAWRAQALAVSRACGANATEADDVAQDVLLKLWLMRDEMASYRSPEALVTVMARNLTIDVLRRNKGKTVNATSIEPVDNAGDPMQRLISDEEEQRLLALVRSLPTRQHAVLVMRQVEHRSYDEIGRLLGIGEASAKTLLSRARQTLLKKLQSTSK